MYFPDSTGILIISHVVTEPRSSVIVGKKRNRRVRMNGMGLNSREAQLGAIVSQLTLVDLVLLDTQVTKFSRM